VAAKKGIQQKVGRKKKQSWEAQELSDINKYWKPELMTREYNRKLIRRKT
jgi:hypothetical protein